MIFIKRFVKVRDRLQILLLDLLIRNLLIRLRSLNRSVFEDKSLRKFTFTQPDKCWTCNRILKVLPKLFLVTTKPPKDTFEYILKCVHGSLTRLQSMLH